MKNIYLKENKKLKIKITNLENNLNQFLIEKDLDKKKIEDFMNNLKIIDKFSIENKNLKLEIDQIKKENEKLKIKNKNLIENENLLRKENFTLNSTISILENKKESNFLNNYQYQSLQFENSKLQKEISIVESNNANLTVEIHSLKSKLKHFENEEIIFNNKENQISEINKNLIEKNKEILNINKKFENELKEIKKNLNNNNLINEKILNEKIQLENIIQNQKKQLNLFFKNYKIQINQFENNFNQFKEILINNLNKLIKKLIKLFQKLIKKNKIFNKLINSLFKIDIIQNNSKILSSKNIFDLINYLNIIIPKINNNNIQIYLNDLKNKMSNVQNSLHEDHLNLIFKLNNIK